MLPLSELERKVLAKMLDPKQIQLLMDLGLRAIAFEDRSCRQAFSWMVEYWENNAMSIAPTLFLMDSEFPTIKLPPKVEESAEVLAQILQDRLIINRVNEAVLEAGKNLHNDPQGTVTALWQVLYGVTEDVVPRVSRSDMFNAAEREARYRARKASVTGGVPFGLTAPDGVPSLDDHTHGQLPGELAVCAAFTKIGKSFLLCKSATAAHLAGHNPILFTLEMSVKEMEDRIDAFHSGVPYAGLTAGDMMPSLEDDLKEARQRIIDTGRPIRIERPARGERTVKQMVNRARQVGADYMLIDQLSFMDPAADRKYAGDNSGMRMKHGDIVFELKDEIARESAGALPCMLAVQHNRDTMRNGDARGALHNLANSSFIEQTADIVLGLWRNQDMRDSNLMGMDIMGSRRSDKKSWMLHWRLHDRTQVAIQREYDE